MAWEARSFIDLRQDPDATVLSRVTSGGTDDGYVQIPIGFDFPFYGSDFDRVYASTNGLLTFGSGSTTFSNSTIPSTSGPENLIAVFWDDLVMRDRTAASRDPSIRYQVRGTAPNRHIVIQWSNFSFLGGQNWMTFEAILHENGTIQTLYEELTGESASSNRASGDSATFGVENSTGRVGVLRSYNRADAVRPGTVLTYRPAGASYAVSRLDNLVSEFLDIRSSGASAGMDCDDCLSAAIPIGFGFRFYNTTYTQVEASSNGWVGLGTTHSASDYSNNRLPSTSEPRPMVGCFWDDLYGVGADSTASYQTIGSAGDRTFIVQYTNWHTCCSTETVTMTYQMRFHEATGVVDCVYGPLEGTEDSRRYGSSATIAIQNAAGNSGVTFAHNSAVLEPGDRVGFFPRDEENTNYLAYGADDNYVDISRTGTISTATGDDSGQLVPLGFTFEYYGRDVSSIYLTSNGQVNLSSSSDYTNTALPNAAEPRALIGPFWDDLYNPASGSRRIRYQTVGAAGSRTFIAQWQQVQFYSPRDGYLSFQIQINEADDTIEFAYGGLLPAGAGDWASRRLRASGSSTTVGLQNYDRDAGLTIGNNNEGTTLTGSWFYFRPMR